MAALFATNRIVMFQINAVEVIFLLVAALVLLGCASVAVVALVWLRRIGRELAAESGARSDLAVQNAEREAEESARRASEAEARAAETEARRALAEVRARLAEDRAALARSRRESAQAERELMHAETELARMRTRLAESEEGLIEDRRTAARATAAAEEARARAAEAQQAAEEANQAAAQAQRDAVVARRGSGADRAAGAGVGLDAEALQRMASDLGVDVSLVSRVADAFGRRGLSGLRDVAQRWSPSSGRSDGAGDDQVRAPRFDPADLGPELEKLLGRDFSRADLNELMGWLGGWFGRGSEGEGSHGPIGFRPEPEPPEVPSGAGVEGGDPGEPDGLDGTPAPTGGIDVQALIEEALRRRGVSDGDPSGDGDDDPTDGVVEGVDEPAADDDADDPEEDRSGDEHG